MVREVLKGACDGLTADQLFGFQRLPVSGQDELGFGLGGGRTVSQCAERFTHSASIAHSNVDVVAQENSARHVRGVVVACAKAFEGRLLVAEGSKEGVGKFRSVKGLGSEVRYG